MFRVFSYLTPLQDQTHLSVSHITPWNRRKALGFEVAWSVVLSLDELVIY